MTTPSQSALEASAQRPAALVVGGSAGALGPLAAVLHALPPTFPAPVAAVLHLPRGKPSALAPALAARAPLPVREVEDKEPLSPGVVYLAPPDYHLLIERGLAAALSIDPPVNYSRPSIDLLFQSAAWALGPRLVGLLLSGANEDGAEGLSAIARAGGLALVQDPDEAEMDVMPRAGLRACRSARPLTARAAGELLVEIWSRGAGFPGGSGVPKEGP